MRAPFILLAATLAYAPLAGAHHGWSEYDLSKPVTLTGTIVESGYEHPHGHIRLQVPDKVWQVVLAPPSRMQARGLPRSELKPGARVSVTGYPNRSKAQEMRAERITLDDKTIELR